MALPNVIKKRATAVTMADHETLQNTNQQHYNVFKMDAVAFNQN